MASARALCLPSVASRVFRTEVGTGFRNTPERKVDGTIPGTSTKTREAEIRSTYGSEVRGMREEGFSFVGRVE